MNHNDFVRFVKFDAIPYLKIFNFRNLSTLTRDYYVYLKEIFVRDSKIGAVLARIESIICSFKTTQIAE